MMQNTCVGIDPENPKCARLTLSGKMKEVNTTEELKFANRHCFQSTLKCKYGQHGTILPSSNLRSRIFTSFTVIVGQCKCLWNTTKPPQNNKKSVLVQAPGHSIGT